VLTFGAWRALGRTVRKGEKGIPVHTWVPIRKRDETTGEESEVGKRPKVAYVFHVAQTAELEGVKS
jgi:antirestriction protein ArdC